MVFSATYVWAAAALEQFVRAELRLLGDTMTAAAVSAADVRPSLQALLLKPSLDGLSKLSGLNAWLRRAEIFERSSAQTPAVFLPQVLPVDGRTLKAEHFEAIWRIYGFTGKPVPSQRHVLALKELAVFRNDLAHGTVDPVSFGRAKTVADALRAIQSVEDVAEHLHTTADAYLAAGAFRRA